MTPREAVIIHALRCREALYRGEPCPVYAGPSLVDAELRDADLRDVDLTGADLTGADLEGADLRSAVLRGAILFDADLTGTNMTGTDFTGADLRSAVMACAAMKGAVLTRAVVNHGTIVRWSAGCSGGHDWHAYVTDNGTTWLQYGLVGAKLDTWLQNGQSVAIAAAVRLRDGGAK